MTGPLSGTGTQLGHGTTITMPIGCSKLFLHFKTDGSTNYASPALPKTMSIVIERSASSDVARSQRIQREFGIRITGMADRVKYKFKVTVVSSAGCSPASSWSIAMKRRSVKEEKVSAAALNRKAM